MRVEEPGATNAVSPDPDRPVYQVNIFTRLSEPADVPEERRGFLVEEWKLHDVEVPEVLVWADDKAAGRPYTVGVASCETGYDAYLIHLFGEDPNRGIDFDDEPYRLGP
jgi:hypothetical protein